MSGCSPARQGKYHASVECRNLSTAQAVAGTIKIVAGWTFDLEDYDGSVWMTPWEGAGVALDDTTERYLDQYGDQLAVPDAVLPIQRRTRSTS